MSNFSIPFSLDDYFSTTPIGSVERAETNNLYGFNHRQVHSALQMNKDLQGLTFFVRPQLNLQQDNIRNTRKLYTLLTSNELSIPAYIRNTLDPRSALSYNTPGSKVPAKACPLVDPHNAFIPILTNNLSALSGWPDITQQTFSSKPGVYNEVYSQTDGIIENYGEFDLDATFRNIKGDPIIYMMYIWLMYQSLVFQGNLLPYPDFMIENEIDYNTRIYRLILDVDKKTVKKIFSSGISFPISVPTSQFADFSSDRPYNEQSKDITIRFRCLGAQAFDDILISEFNSAVCIFNKQMLDDGTTRSGRESTMVKIPLQLLNMFNHRGYPRINLDTYELEWWVDKQIFLNKSKALNDSGLLSYQEQNLVFSGYRSDVTKPTVSY